MEDRKEAKEVILDTLPKSYKGVYTNDLDILEPFEEKRSQNLL